MSELIDPSKYRVKSVTHDGPNPHSAAECPSKFPACQEVAQVSTMRIVELRLVVLDHETEFDFHRLLDSFKEVIGLVELKSNGFGHLLPEMSTGMVRRSWGTPGEWTTAENLLRTGWPKE